MFERFTKDARDVVRGAVGHCAGAGAPTVGAEHLLLALLDREASRGSFALAALGLDGEGNAGSVRAALDEARGRAGLSRAEVDALAGLGVDVLEIVSRVEEAHGVGALSGGGRGGRRPAGRPGFGRDAKRVLERSLRMATARRERHIGDEHILLALTVLPGPPAEVLADHGVPHESVTRVLYGGGGEGHGHGQGQARAS